MGIQEIKEEILSRKLREKAGEIRHRDPLLSEALMSLSIKNHFLSEVWQRSNNIDINILSDHVGVILPSLGIKNMYDLGEHFEFLMNNLTQWIKNTFPED